MAEVPIAVLWDSRKETITVVPELAHVYWGKGHDDTALWTFLSDDPDVTLQKIEFDTPDQKGPFGVLASAGPVQWRGSQLKKEDRIDKYTVFLSNGKDLDPGVRNQEHPL